MVEFAGIFAGLGARTTLVYRGDLFLRGFDDSVREFVKAEIEKKRINFCSKTTLRKLTNKLMHKGKVASHSPWQTAASTRI